MGSRLVGSAKSNFGTEANAGTLVALRVHVKRELLRASMELLSVSTLHCFQCQSCPD